MRAARYRLRIGAIECLVVSDGTFTYAPPTFPPPATFLFCNAPKALLRRTLVAYPPRCVNEAASR